jgi:hypothetical protein
MRSHGMPFGRLAVALLVVVGCSSGGPVRPTTPKPVGLPDMDVEADRQTVYPGPDGGAAIVDRVELSVRNRSDRPRQLLITRVERLHGSCESKEWDDVRALTVHQPVEIVNIAPAETLDLAVVFEPVECYSVCDRFGFRVHVDVDGAPMVLDALIDVQGAEDRD